MNMPEETITINANEKKLMLVLLDRLTIKSIDVDAIPISLAAQSLLVKLQPQPQLEIAESEPNKEEVA
jgi:hypothetical protein